MGLGQPSILTIVIGTYHNPEMLRWCLRTLTKYSPWDYRIVVVDGAEEVFAQNKTLQATVDIDWELEVISLGENRKAMGAFNAGLANCDTPYIAFLHDDTRFIPNSFDFWSNLVETISDERVGMVGPALSDCVGLQNYIRWDLPTLARVWYLYAACLIFRTNVIRNLGGMDEEISPGDDIELSVRMNKEGYSMVIDRRCFLMHLRHQTYKNTRKGDDSDRLEVSFNQIIRKHGVAAMADVLSHETEWDLLPITCPTIAMHQARAQGGAPEWLAL